MKILKSFFPFFILINLVNFNNLYAQNHSLIQISYSKSLESKLQTNKKDNIKLAKFNYLLTENSSSLSYSLIIDKDSYQSKFEENKTLVVDNLNQSFRKLAGEIGGTRGSFYINSKDSIYINTKTLSDRIYNIKMEVKTWKITNETKFIQNFKCFKAIALNNSSKKTEIAWFTPELPSFFGPANYFGLPGTILEIDNGIIVLTATNVEKSISKKENIFNQRKGEIITQKEFESLINKLAVEKYGN